MVDGDTLEIHGQRIRLHAIDAPEREQTGRAEGKEYRCGQKAALALADKIGQRPITCQPRDSDRYGRIVAVCWLGAEDLGAWMVSGGWALAYRQYGSDYAPHEDAATQARRGRPMGRRVRAAVGLARLAGQPITNELDIYRTASLLIKQHGQEAPIHAAMRADEFAAKCHLEGRAVWSATLTLTAVRAEIVAEHQG